MRELVFLLLGTTLVTWSASAQEGSQTDRTTAPSAVPLPTVSLPKNSAKPQRLPDAQASDESEVSLEELIRRAEQYSPRLQIARENLNAARNRAKSVRAVSNPTLQLVPGVGGNSNSRDEEIILAQPLDVFGLRRSRAKVSAAEVRSAEAENQLAVRVVKIEVRNAALLLFRAQESQRLEEVQVEVAQQFRDAASKRAALGDVPSVQVQRAELELLRSQNNLATARTERLTRRTTINALIGAPLDASLRVTLPFDSNAVALLNTRINPANLDGEETLAKNLPVSSSVLSDTQEASPATSAGVGGALVEPDAGTSNLALRPDVLSAQATLEARQAEVQALGRARLPQFELQVRQAPFFGRDNSATSFRAVITLPLFDFGAIKGQRNAAQAEAGAQAARVKLLQQQVATQLETARVQLRSRREIVVSYQKQLVPLSLDLLRKTQIGYAQGASSYLEVLEAQRALRQVQTEYLQALVGVQNAETSLNAAIYGGVTRTEGSFGDAQ